MRPRRVRSIAAALLAATVLACAGCTTIPLRSSPQVVQSVNLGSEPTPDISGPRPDAQPGEIVSGFLDANGVDPAKHSSARAYLSPGARNTWSDTSATVLADETVGGYTPGRPITVTGRVVGTLDSSGSYTPVLQGAGRGGPPVPFRFGVRTVKGQYRIDSLHNGLILTEAQFATYRPRSIYFFGQTGTYLVPDLRYSALSDPVELGDWLLDQLGAGPATQLHNAVSTEGFPAQTNLGRLSVTLHALGARIEIPGAAQLSGGGRDRLAAQVGTTLEQAFGTTTLTITDGGRPVSVPAAGGSSFTSQEFGQVSGPPAPAREVFYVRGGRVVGSGGRALAGPLGNGEYYLSSVALAPGSVTGDLLAAGVVVVRDGPPHLWVGTNRVGLAATTVSGALSRPAWAPDQSEVWIGEGSRLLRLTVSGRTAKVAVVPLLPASVGVERVTAVRVSPDGSRVALVLQGPGSAGRLYVGAIVRGAGQVRVDALTPVSPDGVVVTDVGWLDPLKLDAIGYDARSRSPAVYETGVDGSVWRSGGTSGLPGPPDSLAVTVGAPAWVSASSDVWTQRGEAWTSVSAGSPTVAGSAPTYLE